MAILELPPATVEETPMDGKTIEFEALGRRYAMRWDIRAIQAAQNIERGSLAALADTLAACTRRDGMPIERAEAVQIIDDIGMFEVAHLLGDVTQAAAPSSKGAFRAARSRLPRRRRKKG